VSRRDTAADLLDHYITLLMTKAGLKPDSDTHAELAECVDAIIDAALEAARTDDAIGQRMDAMDRRLDKHERQLRAQRGGGDE